MNQATPFVRVVVLAYDGVDMTLECIRSILRSDWPSDRLEVVLVDNGSLDDVVGRVRLEFPQVRILEPMRNLGFAGGCNLGIRSTRCSSGELLSPFELVALVNNDATVSVNWLTELVAPLTRDVGAASPKMLFHDRYSEVEMSGLSVDVPSKSMAAVRVTAVRIDGERRDDSFVFDEGFAPLGDSALPTHEVAHATRLGGRVRVVRSEPDSDGSHVVSMRLESDEPGRVRLRTDVDEVEFRVEPSGRGSRREGHWVDVRIGSDVFDVVNNVGSELYIGGSAGDRGFLQRDVGQFDEPAEVFAWCGGAVLLRKEYLDDVGLFDESFFLYYEDTDLAWRGRLRGWRYLYTPNAVVRHRHAQSSVAGSDLFKFQVARNRLIVLTKNAPRRIALQAIGGEIQRAWRTVIADVLTPLLRLSPPRLREASLRKKVLTSFVSLLPSAIRHRLMLRSRISRRRVFEWAVEKVVPIPLFEEPGDLVSENVPDSESRHDRDPFVSSGRRTVGVYNLFWDTYGGGEVVAGGLARVMSANHEVTLLGPNRPDADEFKDRLGVDIAEFAWREVSDDVEASQASADYDLFINCTYSSRVVNRAVIGLYYVHFPRKLVPRTKKVVLENSLRLVRLAAKTPFKTSKLQTAERVFRESLIDDSWVSSYTTFIANSRYTARWIEKIWNRDSVVIHPPVPAHVSDSEKSHVIACVGRFFDPIHGHSKKQLELLTAFADMARSHLGVDDWRLTLIGGADARSRDYVMRIRRAAVELPVEVHVNVDKDVVDRTLAGASIYWHATGYDEDELAHPDRLEHFGISVVEAMAAGAVPLVFGSGGPAEIVRHGVDGFHWHTLEQLAQLTRRLMGDSELRSSMSNAARERARDFAPEVFDRSVRDLVESLKVGPQTR